VTHVDESCQSSRGGIPEDSAVYEEDDLTDSLANSGAKELATESPYVLYGLHTGARHMARENRGE
jgi:hypothetical protein